MARLTRMVGRILRIVTGVVVGYLVLANAALQLLPLQDEINERATRLRVEWGSVWTLFPGIFAVWDLRLSGGTPRLMSYFRSDIAVAHVALAPLARRELQVRWARVKGVEVRVRQRPGGGRFEPRHRAFYPTIPGASAQDYLIKRDALAESSRPPWNFVVKGAELQSVRSGWFNHVRLTGNVTLKGEGSYRQRGSLEVTALAVDGPIDRVTGDQRSLATRLDVNGIFRIAPVIPRSHRGRAMLRFIDAEVRVRGDLEPARLFDRLMAQPLPVSLTVAGPFEGQLHLRAGVMQQDSRIRMPRAAFRLQTKRYELESDGLFMAQVNETDKAFDTPVIDARIDSVDVLGQPDRARIFTAGRVQLKFGAPVFDLTTPIENPVVEMRIGEESIADVTVFNEYLPERLGVTLLGGSGQIASIFRWRRSGVRGMVDLSGNGIQVVAREFPLTTNLRAKISVETDEADRSVDIAGSTLSLSETRIAEGLRGSGDWAASLDFNRGTVFWDRDRADPSAPESNGTRALRFKSGQIELSGSVTDIHPLNVLFARGRHVAFSGPGEIEMALILEDEELLSGSTIHIQSAPASVEFLDYRATGTAILEAAFQGDRRNPRLKLDAHFDMVKLAHEEQARPHLSAESLWIQIDGQARQLTRGLTGVRAEIRLPEARVPDVSVYNRYLPETGQFQLLTGPAQVDSTFVIKNNHATGKTTLRAAPLKMRIRDREVSGDVEVDLSFKGVDLERRVFDVSGSSIRVTNADFRGTPPVEAAAWSGSLVLENGRVILARPMESEASLRLQLQDSGPIIDLFLEDEVRSDWLRNLVSVENVTGEARLTVGPRYITLHSVDVGGENLRVKAKLQLKPENTDGILYARLGALSTAVEISGTDRRWRLLRPARHYEAYPPFERSGSEGLPPDTLPVKDGSRNATE